jgi:cytochrome bd-type quinol oxidase subunit 2
LIKTAVVIVLILIVASLASGLFFLVKDKGKTDRTARALTVRIALSVALFALVMLAVATGQLKPHGIYAPSHPVNQKSRSD